MTSPDPAPLPRTLLRIRHDFVMMGRASAEPLPASLSEALRPTLDRIGGVIADYFRRCAFALRSRQPPPDLQPLRAALGACAAQIGALRQRTPGDLPASQLERVFALGFALDQFQNNVKDLQRCIQEWTLPQRGAAKHSAA